MPKQHQDMAADIRTLLSVKETAKILHLSRSAVYELIKHEGLPSFTIGGSRRIHPKELEQWIEQHKHPP